MNFKKKADFAVDILIIGLGTALYAVALTVFLEPSGISPGGVTGLAAIVAYLTGLPTGILTVALNLPLFIWGYIKLGGSFVARTAVATLVMSVWIDLFAALMPQYTGDRLLAALYGGFLGGTGLAMVFLRGSSTGGTDIAAKIISRRFPRLSIGRLVLILDGVIILLSALVYRSFETALYTTLTIFLSTRVIDSSLFGAVRGKLAIIVTANPQEVTQAIYLCIKRGVTQLSAKGGYSKEERALLLCAVRVGEVAALRRGVDEADPHSFVVIAEAGEILGEGFERTD